MRVTKQTQEQFNEGEAQELPVRPEDAQTLDELEMIMSGAPVPFELNGFSYALRQPTPLEVDRLRFVERTARAWAQSQPMIRELQDQPASPLKMALFDAKIAALREALGGDSDEAVEAAEEIEVLQAIRPRNQAEERIQEYVRDSRNTWIVENLLVSLDGVPLTEAQRRQFRLDARPSAAQRPGARDAAQMIMRLLTYTPKG